MEAISDTTFIYGLFINEDIDHKIFYIGKSNNPASRYKNHLHFAFKKNTWVYNKIQNVLNNGGTIGFDVLDEVPRTEWILWEKRYILLFKSLGSKLTNICNGGNGDFSAALREKAMQKLRKPILQYTEDGNFVQEFPSISAAAKALKCCMSGIGECVQGKHETSRGFQWRCKKVNEPIELKINAVIPMEQRESVLLGHKKTQAKNIGKVMPQHIRDKVSKAKMGMNSGINHFRATPVLQINKDGVIIKEWESINMAAVSLKTHNSNILKVLNKERHTAGGFKWEYLHPELRGKTWEARQKKAGETREKFRELI